jgi:recombination DNA repair RAD52 pathway protein
MTEGHANLAAWDVKAHLTRMFGFGNWTKEILRLDLLVEHSEMVKKNDRERLGWWVTYGCDMRLTVKDESGQVVWFGEDTATGSASNQPQQGDAHDLARKNAVSYALKRCATDLGDQFGLSLYNRGSMMPVVGMTLVGSVTPAAEPDHQVEGEDYDPDDPGRPFDA